MAPQRRGANMPGLTGKTAEASPSNRTVQAHHHHPQSSTPTQRTSSSPIPPPIEPLSPILQPASLATSGASSSKQTDTPGGPASKTFTHAQAPTQYVSQPPSKSISLEDNPDAIALRAAISILQMQKRKAEGDLVALHKVKDRAREDPEGFRDALAANEIPKKTDGLFDLSLEDIEGNNDVEDDDEVEEETEDEDEEEEEEEVKDTDSCGNNTGLQRNRRRRRIESNGEVDEEMVDAPGVKDTAQEQNEDEGVDDPMADSDQPGPSSTSNRRTKTKKWPPLPARQNVVRMPAINWSQYAVVGESLDKLHEDQRRKPMDGVPQLIGPDGRVKPVEAGKQRSQPAVIAAAYDPFSDKIEKAEKMSTRKGGKR